MFNKYKIIFLKIKVPPKVTIQRGQSSWIYKTSASNSRFLSSGECSVMAQSIDSLNPIVETVLFVFKYLLVIF